MSWANVLSTGKGGLEMRVMVEGWPYQWVTHLDMEQTLADTRIRIAGLQRAGLVLEEMAMPHLAELDTGSITIQVVDRQADDGNTKAFFTLPTITTYLGADIDTTANTASTIGTGWSTGAYAHIGTEVISPSGISGGGSPTWTGVSRSQWDTIAQSHYTLGDDLVEHLSLPPITNQPLGMEGRRGYIYVYGDGDDLTGDGTLVWRGICATDAKLTRDGVTWEFTLDGITKVWEVEMGADIDEGLVPRGAFYPDTAPLILNVTEGSNSAVATSGAFPSGASHVIRGHYESNAELVAAVNSALTTTNFGGGSWQNQYVAVAQEHDWWIEATVLSGAGGIKFPYIGAMSVLDGVLGYAGSGDVRAAVGLRNITTEALSLSVAKDTTYRTNASVAFRGERTIPRGYYGNRDNEFYRAFSSRPFSAGGTSATRRNKIYLSAGASLTTLDGAAGNLVLPTRDGSSTESYPVSLAFVNTTDNSLSAFRPVEPDVTLPGVMYSSARPLELEATMAFGGSATAGQNLAGFMTYVTSNSPTEANRGRLPFVTTSDISTNWNARITAGDHPEWVLNRFYFAIEAFDLNEAITHECRMLGMFPALDANGRITLVDFDAPLATDVGSTALTGSAYLIDEGVATFERNSWGNLTKYKLHWGWDISEQEFASETTVRDVTAGASHKTPKMLEVKPISRQAVGLAFVHDVRTIAVIASKMLTFFGRDYALITCGASFTEFNRLVGSKATLTLSHIPDGAGGRGITSKPAIVVGRRWQLDTGRGELTFLVSYSNIGGYAPALGVTAESLTGDNEWDLTVSSADPDGHFQAFADGHNISDHFAGQYRIEARQWNNHDPTMRQGTLISVTDSQSASGSTPATGVLSVLFDGAVSMSSGKWTIGYAISSDGTSAATGTAAAQLKYVYISDAAFHIETYAGSNNDANKYGG